MIKGKFLHTNMIKDYQKGGVDIQFSVYGLFDTEKVLWTYRVISHIPDGKGFRLTGDICGYDNPGTLDTIKNYGKKFDTKEDGVQYIQEFKDKWEYGSNDTRQEKRDKKIDDILDK